ncbi:MAG: phage integrase N-terminal SAM-like domain-containing protein [Candidatus Sabulitectum sp.]|nr:phage integrase N-terminal SAM-like domain-containing protein [Candidatus Sabulitectum sp.]
MRSAVNHVPNIDNHVRPVVAQINLNKPRLLYQMHESLRSRHYSPRKERSYCNWVKRFIHFPKIRHPRDKSEPEINAFLTHLAVKENVSASTQKQTFAALVFLYQNIIGREVSNPIGIIRARKQERLPIVMTHEEVKSVLTHLVGDKWLIASLMYGTGMRQMECMSLPDKSKEKEVV